jgi:hypothetical protein
MQGGGWQRRLYKLPPALKMIRTSLLTGHLGVQSRLGAGYYLAFVLSLVRAVQILCLADGCEGYLSGCCAWQCKGD